MRKINRNFALTSALAMGCLTALCQTCTPLLAAAKPGPIKLSSPALNEEGSTQNPAIILKPGQSRSLKGRIFKVFQIFDVSISPDGKAFSYSWNEKTRPSIQQAVSSWLKNRPDNAENVEPDKVTQEKAIATIESLNEADPGSLEPDTGAFRKFCALLRDQFVKDGVQPVKEATIPADYDQDTYSFTGLSKGYYLVDEVIDQTSPNGFGGSLCLVSTISGPKELTLKGVFPEVEKKIEEDDSQTSWNDIGDFEAGQPIPYKYEVIVPNIAGYKTYKMNFHDRMDSCLSLKADSVKVEISQGDKTAVLTKDQFTVDTTATDEKTFSVNIPDIKAVIDQEFYPAGTDQAAKTYGQKITVSYTANLNSAAALNPGRPGFENQVRLEYSNDPEANGQGTTGFTPWDTVVAFTFHFSGLKVAEPQGNENARPLAGAHFELYADKDCTKKITLIRTTRTADGKEKTAYIVKNELNTVPEGAEEASEIITQSDGAIEIYGLDQGEYYLRETQAPEGYHGPLSPIKLTITPEYTTDRDSYSQGDGHTEKTLKKLTGTIAYTEGYDGKQTAYQASMDGDEKKGSLSGQIINRSGEELPLTGSNTAWISLAGGTAVMAAGLITLFFKKSKPADQA